MQNNILLHVNNWGKLGGIECTVMDFARAFPQFFHILFTLNNTIEDYEYISYLRERDIEYMTSAGAPVLRRATVEKMNPFAVLLHNTNGKNIEGKYPFKWLTHNYHVIGVHHNVTHPLVPAEVDWFVSDYVRRPYRKLESKMNAFTLPPCVYAKPFLEIQRPDRKAVVGRIQSATNMGKGKVPDKFFEMLKQLKNCDLCVNKPIKPGKMAEYLKEMDIFVIWGNTTESWSRVATEANLSGIPVVARDMHDGLTEQLHKSGGGLLVDTEIEFVETIQMLIDNPKRRSELGRAGRKWCLDNATTTTLRDRLSETLLNWGLGTSVLQV